MWCGVYVVRGERERGRESRVQEDHSTKTQVKSGKQGIAGVGPFVPGCVCAHRGSFEREGESVYDSGLTRLLLW